MFGPRYLELVFTPHELECSNGAGWVQAQSLAARFAAKEATMKVLRPGLDDIVPWISIEIWRSASGWCEVILTGEAEMLATQNAVSDLAVSFSHEGQCATAVVVAMCGK
jgi:holo-[acyl-carrier protein] synthase